MRLTSIVLATIRPRQRKWPSIAVAISRPRIARPISASAKSRNIAASRHGRTRRGRRDMRGAITLGRTRDVITMDAGLTPPVTAQIIATCGLLVPRRRPTDMLMAMRGEMVSRRSSTARTTKRVTAATIWPEIRAAYLISSALTLTTAIIGRPFTVPATAAAQTASAPRAQYVVRSWPAAAGLLPAVRIAFVRRPHVTYSARCSFYCTAVREIRSWACSSTR